MSRYFGIGFFIALVVIGGVGYFFFRATPSAPTPEGGNPFGNPAGNATTSSDGGSSTGTIFLTTTSGGKVSVPDFTQGKRSMPIGSYQFYLLTNNQDVEGPAAQFEILYGTDSSITITLLKEPLGAARLAAEDTLKSFIAVSDATFCTFNVHVGVPFGVNKFYASQNLGLSFCPGATPLPQ